MKKTTTIPLLFAAAMMLAAPAAEARGGRGGNDACDASGGQGEGMRQGRFGRKRGKRGKLTRMKAMLGLSDTQVEQIKALRAGARARTEPQRKQLAPLRKQMRTLMQADVFDAGQIYALRAKMRSLRQLIGEERFKARLQMMQLLTKEQRMKIKQRGKRWHKGNKRFQRGGFGKRGAANIDA